VAARGIQRFQVDAERFLLLVFRHAEPTFGGNRVVGNRRGACRTSSALRARGLVALLLAPKVVSTGLRSSSMMAMRSH
jgi:hypothetical protein